METRILILEHFLATTMSVLSLIKRNSTKSWLPIEQCENQGWVGWKQELDEQKQVEEE